MTTVLPRDRSSLLIGAVWLVVVLLALLGVGAAIGRGLFVSDFTTRQEPHLSTDQTSAGLIPPYLDLEDELDDDAGL